MRLHCQCTAQSRRHGTREHRVHATNTNEHLFQGTEQVLTDEQAIPLHYKYTNL